MLTSSPAPRVLVLKSELLPYSETFIREQILALRRWSAVLVGTQLMNGLTLDGLKVQVLHGSARIRRFARALDLDLLREGAQMRSLGPQLIHAHFGYEGVRFWPAVRQLDMPYIVTLHGADINIDPASWAKDGGYVGKKYTGRLLFMAKSPNVQFIAVSEAIKTKAIERGIPADKLTVMRIGVDARNFTPSPVPIECRKNVLFVGRMVEKKGGEYLIRAFSKISSQLPDATLTMIGDGPLLADYKTLAANLNVQVRFTGRLPADAVRQHLFQARALCLPSITASNGDAEGLGMVILEAQACGVPVVTSATGGATEGIDVGRSGLAFGERDVPALAAALNSILSDDTLASSMALAGPPFVARNFDLEDCTAQLEEYYDRWSATRH